MRKLSYIILFLFFTTCKKDIDLHTSASGVVLESGASKPVGGATVLLRTSNSDCFSCGTSTIASYTADANGNFSFDFTTRPNLSYSLGASKNRYFENVNTGIYLDIGKKNDAKKISLDPEAYLKIHIKNAQPFDNNDLITVDGDWNCCSASNFYGNKVETFITNFEGSTKLRIRGNKNSSIVWFVTKNLIKKNYSDNIYCPAFDTTYYNINY